MSKTKEPKPIDGKKLLEEVKSKTKQNQTKETNNMNKKHIIETIKTILITILLTGIVAFIGGVKYQEQTNVEIQSQAKALVTTVATPSK